MKLAHREAHDVDLEALAVAWSGAPLRERVRSELRTTRKPVQALAETIEGLEEREQAAFERLQGEVSVLAADEDFWAADAGAVARDLVTRYEALLGVNGHVVEAPECHAALRGVLLSLAFLVQKNRAVRRLSGIRKRFFRW